MNKDKEQVNPYPEYTDEFWEQLRRLRGPRFRPRELAGFRAQYGLPEGVSIDCIVYPGEEQDPRWKGWQASAWVIPVEVVRQVAPSLRLSPWSYVEPATVSVDGYDIPETRYVILRWRVWRPGQAGFLQKTWYPFGRGTGSEIETAAIGLSETGQAAARQLLDLIDKQGRRGRPRRRTDLERLIAEYKEFFRERPNLTIERLVELVAHEKGEVPNQQTAVRTLERQLNDDLGIGYSEFREICLETLAREAEQRGAGIIGGFLSCTHCGRLNRILTGGQHDNERAENRAG